MELVLPLLVSVLVEVVKRVSAKLGHELTANLIKLVVLGGCVIAAYVLQKQLISIETLKSIGQTLALAVAYYEVGYKWIIQPVVDKIGSR